MAVAADVGNGLERAAGHQRTRFSKDHFFKEAFAVLLRERRSDFTRHPAGVAAVGNDQDVPRGNHFHLSRDFVGHDPSGSVVAFGVHGQPVGFVGFLVIDAVTGIVNQEACVFVQIVAVVIQRFRDLIARGIHQNSSLKSVLIVKQSGERLCIGSRGRELWKV